MIRRLAIALGALALLGAPAVASAAGPPLSAFVPDGFRIEKRISANIGGDRHADAVMVLVRHPPAGAPATDATPLARRLVVLKARADGGYVQIGEGRRVLLCTRCGGAFFGVNPTPVTVRVRAKVVIAEQESGSRVLTFQRLRFRAEGALHVRLIGADVRTTDRLTGEVVETSTDYLTGEVIILRTDSRGRQSVRRRVIPVTTTYIEAVDRTRLP